MNKRITGGLLVVLSFGALAFLAQAQEATERFIPIGESPGISGYKSIIGVVAELDYASHRLVVRSNDGDKTVIVDDATRYYVDRSKQNRSNVLGELEDCKAGRRVEIALGDDGNAEWVKIEVPQR